jgi:hypothetical protein
MYIVIKPGLQLSKRAAQVVAICEAGGFVRYALETGYGGREQFQTRVYDASRQVVKGLGYKAAHDAIALGRLKRREVPRGSDWAQEWVAA